MTDWQSYDHKMGDITAGRQQCPLPGIAMARGSVVGAAVQRSNRSRRPRLEALRRESPYIASRLGPVTARRSCTFRHTDTQSPSRFSRLINWQPDGAAKLRRLNPTWAGSGGWRSWWNWLVADCDSRSYRVTCMCYGWLHVEWLTCTVSGCLLCIAWCIMSLCSSWNWAAKLSKLFKIIKLFKSRKTQARILPSHARQKKNNTASYSHSTRHIVSVKVRTRYQ